MTDKRDIPDITAATVAHNGDLRDRIAAAIYGSPPVWDQWPWEDLTDDARQAFREQADAVIRDLGLRRETTYAWRNGRTHPAGTRYATEWERP